MTDGFGEQSRLWISFSVGHFKGDPDEVTRVLGQNPTDVMHKGRTIPNMRVKAKFNLWSLRVDSKSFDLETQIAILLKQLRDLKKLRPKIGNYKAWITVFLEVVGDDTRPALGIPSKQVQALAAQDISLSFDYYFFKKALLKIRRSKK